jgi:hypothetical protein
LQFDIDALYHASDPKYDDALYIDKVHVNNGVEKVITIKISKTGLPWWVGYAIIFIPLLIFIVFILNN